MLPTCVSTDLTHRVPRTSVPMTADQRVALVRSARALASAERKRDALEAERDRLIVEARDAGVSLRAIAATVGLSAQGVRNIVSRADR